MPINQPSEKKRKKKRVRCKARGISDRGMESFTPHVHPQMSLEHFMKFRLLPSPIAYPLPRVYITTRMCDRYRNYYTVAKWRSTKCHRFGFATFIRFLGERTIVDARQTQYTHTHTHMASPPPPSAAPRNPCVELDSFDGSHLVLPPRYW